MEPSPIYADEQGRARGEAYVKSLRAGRRNKYQPGVADFAAPVSRNRSRSASILVFMTDGLPTVDETNVGKIVANVRQASIQGVRLFTFGVGYDVTQPCSISSLLRTAVLLITLNRRKISKSKFPISSRE